MQSRTQWAISSSFYMGLEVMYAKLETASLPFGLINLPANTGKQAGIYSLTDQDIWAVRFRVHRDFYP